MWCRWRDCCRAVDAMLDGCVFMGYIVWEPFVAKMSRYAALSLHGRRCLRAAEFVRINSAGGEAISFVGSPPRIRERDEWSASPSWMRVFQVHRTTDVHRGNTVSARSVYAHKPRVRMARAEGPEAQTAPEPARVRHAMMSCWDDGLLMQPPSGTVLFRHTSTPRVALHLARPSQVLCA